MYNILICDDRGYCREFIKKEVKDFFDRRNEQFTVTEYNSGDEVLFHLRPGFYDLAIFDVEMEGTNGIDTARRYRSYDKNIIIFFATAHPEAVFGSFTAQPLTFLTKPLRSPEVQEALSRSMEQINSTRRRKFMYNTNRTTNVIAVRDILYFESSAREVTAVTITGNHSFYGKLDDVETNPALSGFIRSHKSFLINPDYIQEISSNNIVLTDKTLLPIRRGGSRELRKQFMDYLALGEE